jgi:hypothetical protein
MRTNVYVDGFNLYYGCLRNTPYRWLNLAKLCKALLPKNDIHRIRYFTATVQPRPWDPQQQQRQEAYLRTLMTLPDLTIHRGHFLTSIVTMPLESPPPGGPRTARVIKTEEKGSDVNLATFLLCDAFQNDYEVAVVISNDSDLVFPIRVARSVLGRGVIVLNPHKRPSVELRNAATFVKPIREGALRASQFPPHLTDPSGTIVKPSSW